MPKETQLIWEWPNDREVEHILVIKIDSIKKRKDGFFGAKESPSIDGHLPDAMVLVGSAVSDQQGYSKSIIIEVPNVELMSSEVGDLLELHMLANNICIRISKI